MTTALPQFLVTSCSRTVDEWAGNIRNFELNFCDLYRRRWQRSCYSRCLLETWQHSTEVSSPILFVYFMNQ